MKIEITMILGFFKNLRTEEYVLYQFSWGHNQIQIVVSNMQGFLRNKSIPALPRNECFKEKKKTIKNILQL